MGHLMRQYWIPALSTAELPERDGSPKRLRLLGENLIAFRVTSGAVGLVSNACPHRGASLFFGRNEEEGLRCVYHGWKFDITGTCVDMPSEPAGSDFIDKVRARTYPTHERGGIIWAYMGTRPTPPPLPQLEATMLPEGEYEILQIHRDCNWMQALEGDIDTVHAAFLHAGASRLEATTPGSSAYYTARTRAARFSVIDTEVGTSYGAYRAADADRYYWRIAHYLFPFYTMTPTGVLGVQQLVRIWVPEDDGHTMYWRVSRKGTRGEGGEQAFDREAAAGNRMHHGMEFVPDSTDWMGRWRLAADVTNDYQIDRESQRAMKSYTGIDNGGAFLQDQAVTESMGPIYDREQEHLGSTDAMIIRTRRRIINAAKALLEDGLTPPGVDQPELYAQRSGVCTLPREADWWEATVELRRAFVSHTQEELLAPVASTTAQ
jgi:phenylpropionate dioxygenase-like ring-hydroxylating dioxygenase large terminal subunit